MNSSYEILEKSHQLVITTLEDLPEAEWDRPGACGNWSVKDLLAHIVSYEQVLLEALTAIQQNAEPTAHLLHSFKSREDFNREEVEARRYQTAQLVMDEYHDLQLQTSSLLEQIPTERTEQKGAQPWLGPDRSLADMIKIVTNHAREHCEQITTFRNRVVKA